MDLSHYSVCIVFTPYNNLEGWKKHIPDVYIYTDIEQLTPTIRNICESHRLRKAKKVDLGRGLLVVDPIYTLNMPYLIEKMDLCNMDVLAITPDMVKFPPAMIQAREIADKLGV